MKKAMLLVLVVVLFVSMPLGSSVFADDSKQAKGTPPPMEHEGMGARPPAMSMDLMQNMMVMQAMREKSVVATSDGGVVVLVSNQMVKYDKDLNVVKEAELKVDVDKLRQNIMKMMPNNPMVRENR